MDHIAEYYKDGGVGEYEQVKLKDLQDHPDFDEYNVIGEFTVNKDGKLASKQGDISSVITNKCEFTNEDLKPDRVSYSWQIPVDVLIKGEPLIVSPKFVLDESDPENSIVQAVFWSGKYANDSEKECTMIPFKGIDDEGYYLPKVCEYQYKVGMISGAGLTNKFADCRITCPIATSALYTATMSTQGEVGGVRITSYPFLDHSDCLYILQPVGDYVIVNIEGGKRDEDINEGMTCSCSSPSSIKGTYVMQHSGKIEIKWKIVRGFEILNTDAEKTHNEVLLKKYTAYWHKYYERRLAYAKEHVQEPDELSTGPGELKYKGVVVKNVNELK